MARERIWEVSLVFCFQDRCDIVDGFSFMSFLSFWGTVFITEDGDERDVL